MKGWQKLICRAGVVAGISSLGLLIKEGFPPTLEILYFTGLTFALGFLFFINTAFENDDMDGDGNPDKKDAKDIVRQLKAEKREKQTKKIISCIPNLWFP